jgi:hypothetical protein
MEIIRIDPAGWSGMGSNAHTAVFGEYRPLELDRIDFALLVLDEHGFAAGYVTCQEKDSETVYWQYGGSLPNYKGTIFSYIGYKELIKFCKDHYKRIETRIENKNKTMLGIANRAGFLVQGTYHFKDKLFDELCLEFEGG